MLHFHFHFHWLLWLSCRSWIMRTVGQFHRLVRINFQRHLTHSTYSMNRIVVDSRWPLFTPHNYVDHNKLHGFISLPLSVDSHKHNCTHTYNNLYKRAPPIRKSFAFNFDFDFDYFAVLTNDMLLLLAFWLLRLFACWFYISFSFFFFLFLGAILIVLFNVIVKLHIKDFHRSFCSRSIVSLCAFNSNYSSGFSILPHTLRPLYLFVHTIISTFLSLDVRSISRAYTIEFKAVILGENVSNSLKTKWEKIQTKRNENTFCPVCYSQCES